MQNTDSPASLTQKCDIVEITESSEDVIEELMRTADFMKKKVATASQALLFDMKKYHPKAWKLYQDFKNDFLIEHLKRSFERGIAQGYFRKDIDVDILSTMRIEQIELAFNHDVYSPERFETSSVHMQIFDHFIYGISSMKGHKRLNEIRHFTD